MDKSYNSGRDICSFSCRLIRIAVPAAYLLSVGITFAMALGVGITLLEG